MSQSISGHDPGSETGPRQATPFTRAFYWAFLVMGIALILGGLTSWEPAGAIADLPKSLDLYGVGVNWGSVIHLVTGVPITVGAVLSLLGAQYRERIDESWRFEQAGAIFGAVGWFGLMLAVGVTHPSSLLDSMFPLACTISLIVRWFTLRGREKIVRPLYEAKVKDLADEIHANAVEIQVKAKEIQETQETQETQQ